MPELHGRTRHRRERPHHDVGWTQLRHQSDGRCRLAAIDGQPCGTAEIPAHTRLHTTAGLDVLDVEVELHRVRQRRRNDAGPSSTNYEAFFGVETPEPRPPAPVVIGRGENVPQHRLADWENPRAIRWKRADTHLGGLPRGGWVKPRHQNTEAEFSFPWSGSRWQRSWQWWLRSWSSWPCWWRM